MLSCKSVVKIISSEPDLPFMKKAELKLHLMMCHHCSRYLAHIKMLKASVAELIGNRVNSVDDDQLEKFEEEVIQKTLDGKK